MTRIAPVTSPSHHVIQSVHGSVEPMRPLAARLARPTVAEIDPARAAMAASLKIPGAVRTAVAPPNRCSSRAPTSASTVLPAAMPADAVSDPDVIALTRNAPTAMAGQMRGPNSSTAASATPVAGQTALAAEWTKASESPSRPETKYAAAVRTKSSADRAAGPMEARSSHARAEQGKYTPRPLLTVDG